MPYITSERVKAIREQIKREFPEFKFSITREHHSKVNIVILAGPLDFGKSYKQVNHFYIKDSDDFSDEAKRMLTRIKDIADAGNGILVIDGDYGAVPNFYVDIRIGNWDKPYTIK